MNYVLFVLAGIAFAVGGGIMLIAKSAIHEQLAGQAFVVSAILYGSACIVSKLDDFADPED